MRHIFDNNGQVLDHWLLTEEEELSDYNWCCLLFAGSIRLAQNIPRTWRGHCCGIPMLILSEYLFMGLKLFQMQFCSSRPNSRVSVNVLSVWQSWKTQASSSSSSNNGSQQLVPQSTQAITVECKPQHNVSHCVEEESDQNGKDWGYHCQTLIRVATTSNIGFAKVTRRFLFVAKMTSS